MNRCYRWNRCLWVSESAEAWDADTELGVSGSEPAQAMDWALGTAPAEAMRWALGMAPPRVLAMALIPGTVLVQPDMADTEDKEDKEDKAGRRDAASYYSHRGRADTGE